MDPNASSSMARKETMGQDDPGEISIDITGPPSPTRWSSIRAGSDLHTVAPEVFHAVAEGDVQKLDKYDGRNWTTAQLKDLLGPSTRADTIVLEPDLDHDNSKRKKKETEIGEAITRSSSKKEDGDLLNLKEAKEAHLVVAALIATVTFAAGFTLPGGYIQDSGPELGLAALTRSSAFKAFVISDTIALVFSSAAVFIHLLIAMNTNMKRAENLFNKALPLTLYALLAMVIAFITGTYAVLAQSLSLAIAACVVGCLFFILYGYILGTVVKISIKIGQGFLTCFSDFIRFISCQDLCNPKIRRERVL